MHYPLIYDFVPDYVADLPAVAEAFAAADPYVIHGLVTHWRVRKSVTVIGEVAAMPVVP